MNDAVLLDTLSSLKQFMEVPLDSASTVLIQSGNFPNAASFFPIYEAISDLFEDLVSLAQDRLEDYEIQEDTRLYCEKPIRRRPSKKNKLSKNDKAVLLAKITALIAALQLLQGAVNSYQSSQTVAQQNQQIAAQTETIQDLRQSLDQLTISLSELTAQLEDGSEKD